MIGYFKKGKIKMIDKFKVYYKLTDEQLKDQDPDFKTKYIYIGITEVKLFKRSLGLVVEADACQLVDDINNLIFCKFTGKQDINGLDLFEGDRVEFSTEPPEYIIQLNSFFYGMANAKGTINRHFDIEVDEIYRDKLGFTYHSLTKPNSKYIGSIYDC